MADRKRVTFSFFLIALKSWEEQSASDLCMCPGHDDKSAVPKCLSEIWSRTCTEYNVLLIQETGKGTTIPLCCVSWEACIMQRCSYKCHSLNGNAPGHVVFPGASRSKETSVCCGGTGIFFSSGDVKLWHLQIKTHFWRLCGTNIVRAILSPTRIFY